MRPQTQLNPTSPRRPGAVLLIVITLMALFTAVGLSFVYYAEAEATASKLFRESTDLSRPDVDPELALAYFLGKLIYPERDDDQSGIYNAGRGHDLARGVYGYNYTILPINGQPTVVMLSPQRAYTGTGRLHGTYPLPKFGGNPILAGQDDYSLPIYTYFPADGFLRDPERLYLKPGAMGQPPLLSTRSGPTAGIGAYAGGFNAPYTYPDLNSLYLAAVRADGTVLTPSYHREYLFGRLDDPTNQNWTIPIGKYKTLRPRPIDHAMDPATGKPLFPYPEDRGGDVCNLPQGLGYLGLGGNDSIWIDFNAPVMIAADGRKYKMLFAPLVMDLDGRVNLNVHGNIKNGGTTFAGNQGWVRSEVNLTMAATFPTSGIASVLPNTAEAMQLFQGRVNPNVLGRYGRSNGPHIALPKPPAMTMDQWVRQQWLQYGIVPPVGRWYSKVDFDGINGGPLQMPGVPTFAGQRARAFPTFPVGYNNSNTGEILGPLHPALYNYYTPFLNDRTFPLSNMEALLRYGDKGSPALTSDLFRLMPNSLALPRVRNMVSLLTSDLNRPGLTPWVWDPSAATSWYKMVSKAAGAAPSGAAIPFPTFDKFGTTPPAGSEFNPNWTGSPAAVTTPASAVNRLDLNRNLPDYPAPDATGLIPAAQMALFQTAQTARQQFAKDIYTLLLKVTGGRDPNTPVPAMGTPVDVSEIQAARWLAQLAVNMVDYIDNDDYMTPFSWWVDPKTGLPIETLYGTELPRLLLNEAYAQLDNDANDPAIKLAIPKAGYYQLNLWAEMHNPFKATPAGAAYPRDGGNAVLQTANNLIYRLDVCRQTAVPQLTQQPANATGDPNFNAAVNPILTSVTDWSTVPGSVKPVLPQIVQAANGAYADKTQTNVGFYVAGPQPNFLPGRSPNLPASSVSASLSIQRALLANLALQPTLVLRRLACPHLPANDPKYTPGWDKTKPLNPYITVDYMETLPVNNGLLYSGTGLVAPAPASPTTWASWGRRQPYATSRHPADLNYSQVVPQNPIPWPAVPTQPKNTFFRHNGQESSVPKKGLNTTLAQTLGEVNFATNPLTVIPRFDWLVHLDRPLISPLELLHVSAYRPHLLTHRFITTTTTTLPGPPPVPKSTRHKFMHYAPWFNKAARLYRFFEYATTHDYALGMMGPGRVPGKVNLNTIWDPEVFAALCNHPQAGLLFQNMINLRTPPAVAGGPPIIGPTNLHAAPGSFPAYPLNRPFLGLATGDTLATVANPLGGQYPTNMGIGNTLLRPIAGGGPTSLRLFDVTQNTAGNPTRHPYQNHEVLTKLFNNVTTRSNTFAVFVTVGFFEVKDDSVRPVKLGAEIGRLENRHVRHRFFAIIDRSDLRRLDIGITPNNPPPPQNLQLAAGVQQNISITTPYIVSDKAQAPAAPQMLLNTPGGSVCAVSVGDELVLDPNTANEEVVQITAVVHDPVKADTWQFAFTPARTHTMLNATTPIPSTFRGNPGPWANYNPRLDPNVVRYFSVID